MSHPFFSFDSIPRKILVGALEGSEREVPDPREVGRHPRRALKGAIEGAIVKIAPDAADKLSRVVTEPGHKLAKTGLALAGVGGLGYVGVKGAREFRKMSKAHGALIAAHETAKGVKRQLTTFPTFRAAGKRIAKMVRLDDGRGRGSRRRSGSNGAFGKATYLAAAAKPSVAQDRYVKDIHEQDAERSGSHYTQTAVGGGLIGVLARNRGVSRGKGALVGAGAALAGQALVRAATSRTKDKFGDRSFRGKTADKAIPALALTGAAVLALGRLKRVPPLRGIGLCAKPRAGEHRFAAGTPLAAGGGKLGQYFRSGAWKKPLILGGALGVGIAGADALTSAVMPEPGQTRAQAARHGLIKGAIYGAALAGSEPWLEKGFAKLLKVRMHSAKLNPTLFGNLHPDQAESRAQNRRALKVAAVLGGAGVATLAGVKIADKLKARAAAKRAANVSTPSGLKLAESVPMPKTAGMAGAFRRGLRRFKLSARHGKINRFAVRLDAVQHFAAGDWKRPTAIGAGVVAAGGLAYGGHVVNQRAKAMRASVPGFAQKSGFEQFKGALAGKPKPGDVSMRTVPMAAKRPGLFKWMGNQIKGAYAARKAAGNAAINARVVAPLNRGLRGVAAATVKQVRRFTKPFRFSARHTPHLFLLSAKIRETRLASR